MQRRNGWRFIKSVFKILGAYTWRRAACQKPKGKRKLIKSMLCWLKEFKSKGKYKALRRTKKARAGAFSNCCFIKFISFAGTIVTGEAYFLLN
jgi:hypothetical protein